MLSMIRCGSQQMKPSKAEDSFHDLRMAAKRSSVTLQRQVASMKRLWKPSMGPNTQDQAEETEKWPRAPI